MSAVVFNDHLPTRARQIRFRGIGNPFEFLTYIGIVPIQEKLYRGSNIIDVAEELNIPVTYLLRWIEESGFEEEIAKASTLSAEGYVSKGEKMLREATNKFELDKAKAMIEHGRFMASKKDKKTYGNQVDPNMGAASVTYIFQVGETPPQVIAAQKERAEKSVIDADFKEVEPPAVEVDIFNLDNVPLHAKHKPGVKINAAE